MALNFKQEGNVFTIYDEATPDIPLKELSYEVFDDGYVISANGSTWIDQRGFIPPNYIDLLDKSISRSAVLNIMELVKNEITEPPEITADLEAMQIKMEALEKMNSQNAEIVTDLIEITINNMTFVD